MGMGRWVRGYKHLPCECEDLNFIPRTCTRAGSSSVYNPGAPIRRQQEETDRERPGKLVGQLAWVMQPRNKRLFQSRNEAQHLRLSSILYTHTVACACLHLHTYTCTYMHITHTHSFFFFLKPYKAGEMA